MALKKITKITNKQIAEKGVQALADRPNLTAQYGASGLSAAQLKLWFDKLATFLAERINEISDAISSDEATNYIRVCLDEYGVDNLGVLITAFANGDFAAKILQLFPSAGSEQKQALQIIVNDIAKEIADLKEELYYNRLAIKKFTLSAIFPTKHYNKGDIVVCANQRGEQEFYIALVDGVANTAYPYNRPSQWAVYKPQFAYTANLAEKATYDADGNNISETFSEIEKKISDIAETAPEKFDTLKEIADYLETHGAEATELISAVKALDERTANLSIGEGTGSLQQKGTTATYDNQATFGQYNDNKADTLLEVGNGTSDTDRSNAFEVYKDGRAKVYGTAREDEDVVRKVDITTGKVSPPLATNTSKGVMVGHSTAAFIFQNGAPIARPLTFGEYSKAEITAFIGKGTLENIKSTYVKDGIVGNTQTLTDTEKADACEWLGALKKQTHPTLHNQAYVKSTAGEQMLVSITSVREANAIPRYNVAGQLECSIPNDDYQTANKKYVDDMVNKPYELIEEFTLTEASNFVRTQEPNGTAYNFKEVSIDIDYGENVEATNRLVTNITAFENTVSKTTKYSVYRLWIKNGVFNLSTTNGMYRGLGTVVNSFNDIVLANEYITSINLSRENGYPVGTIFKIYGVRA